MRRAPLALVIVLVAALAAAGSAPAAVPPAGMLVQLAPPADCWSSTAGGGCSPFGGSASVVSMSALAISADGAYVYTGGDNGGGIAFSRSADGTLASIGPVDAGSSTAFAAQGAGLFAAYRDYGSGPEHYGTVSAALIGASGVPASAGSVACTTATCTTNNGLDDVSGVAAGPAAVYAASHSGGGSNAGALTVFSRNPTTQAISQVQCVPDVNAASGLCSIASGEPAQGLAGADSVALSPDGKFLYATGYNDGSVVGFNVVQSGADAGRLGAPVNCLWAKAASGSCGQASGLGAARGLAISPDGRDVYVASFSGGIAALRRDTLSGVLSPNQCLNQTGAGGCTAEPAFVGAARDVAVSPDGREVFVAGGFGTIGYVAAFARDASSGRLTRLGCLSYLPATGCATAAGVSNADMLAVTPDGRFVYVTALNGGDGNGAIAAFAVEAAPTCQGTSVSVQAGASVSVPLACTDANGDVVTRTIAGAPGKGSLGAIDQGAGTVAYTAAASASGADAFSFTGSDGTNASAAATVAVTIAARPAPPAAPRSRIAGLSSRVKASKLKGFHGTASAGAGVKRVDVALMRLSGRATIAKASCQVLTSRGKLKSLKPDRRLRCKLTGFLHARGTTRWSFALRHRLAPGTYVLFSRTTAKNGAVERSFSARLGNRRTFKVMSG